MLEYINNSIKEVKENVTWPGMSSLQGDLLKVFLLSAFFAMSLGLLDIVVRYVLYKLFY